MIRFTIEGGPMERQESERTDEETGTNPRTETRRVRHVTACLDAVEATGVDLRAETFAARRAATAKRRK